MATVIQLAHFLVQLRRYVLRLVKGFFPLALVRILRQITLLFSKFLSKWRSSREPRGRVDKPPSSSSGSSNMKVSKSEPSEEGLHNNLNNLETISLQDVAFSVYPDNGHGIRSVSESSQILRETRSVRANSANEFGDNASCSSHHLSSRSSDSFVSNVESEAPPNTQIIQPNSPTLPTSARKYSASHPYLSRHDNESITPHVSIPDIQLTELNSPGEIDAPSIHIPTRPASPVLRLGTPISRRGVLPVYPASLICPVSPIDSTSPPYLNNPRILPILPQRTQRYERRPRIQRKETPMTIQPLTTTFAKPIAPTGWIKHTHPEGGRYFFNEDKRIYTDADLYNTHILEQATLDIDTLENFISTHHISLPQDTDLVIDHTMRTASFKMSTTMYTIHRARSSSWTYSWPTPTLSAPGHEIEAQYWYFLALYPHASIISPGLISELRDVVLHFVGDFMTSSSSTAPYPSEDLYKILTLTEILEKNVGHQCVGAVSLLSRLMYTFVHSRFLNFHGEAHARIERHVSVFGQALYQRTLLIKTLSMSLFFAPDFHLRDLQSMWVDGIMDQSIWDQWMKKVCDDWEGLVLLATVMLNANVAFLAIQSVDVGSPNRSPAQISSYVSVVASIGSILIGLLLTKQNRPKGREAITEVQQYVLRHTYTLEDLDMLAVLYSLPYAFLMWGMVSFLAAFLLLCFQDSNSPTRILVGSLFCVVIIPVVWCIWTSWEAGFEDAPIEQSPDPVESQDVESESSMADTREPKTTLFSRIASALAAFFLRRRTIDSQLAVA